MGIAAEIAEQTDDVMATATTTSDKLFDVPRVAVLVDDSDPDQLVLTFSGSVELDRTKPRDVEFFNSLREGREVELEIAGHIVSRKVRHKLDPEHAYVVSVIAQKQLAVTSVVIPAAE